MFRNEPRQVILLVTDGTLGIAASPACPSLAEDL